MEEIPGEETQRRTHKKKKDVMISPKKPPNAWTAYINEKLKEVCLWVRIFIIFIGKCRAVMGKYKCDQENWLLVLSNACFGKN